MHRLHTDQALWQRLVVLLQQVVQRNGKHVRDAAQIFDVRNTLATFLIGHALRADVQNVGQLILGQPKLLAVFLQPCSEMFDVKHG